MPGLDSNTVNQNHFETAFIEVSSPTYLILLDAQKALGFDTLGDLVKDMFISTRANRWLEHPELLSVCEKQQMSYDAILRHIDNN